MTKNINLDAALHAQTLGEHIRVQMDKLLELVRESTELYTEHARFINELAESVQNEQTDDSQDQKAPEV